jgi:hypothetical protein
MGERQRSSACSSPCHEVAQGVTFLRAEGTSGHSVGIGALCTLKRSPAERPDR